MRAAMIARREFWGQRPIRVVNICFLVVFICSVLLTWRELVVLEQAYVASQRNSLDNVATGFDRHLQYSVDKLLFYRNAMRFALEEPLDTDVARQMLRDFAQQRRESSWQLLQNNTRSMPINGVSDDFVSQSPLLNRDESRLPGELSAALEFGYLMHLSAGGEGRDMQQSTWYTSRAGFFIASDITRGTPSLLPRYYHQVTRPWFNEHAGEHHRARGISWFHLYDPARHTRTVTASVALDYQHYWYGVLAMDFPLQTLDRYLQRVIDEDEQGDIYLFDSRLQIVAAAQDAPPAERLFDPVQQAQLAHAIELAGEGGLRLDTRYISWVKLSNFDGVLVKVHTVEQGMQGEFGNITVALILFWTLFTAMLLVSWLVIRRMVNNMTRLQSTLTWQAWHDPLTRLYNRGAFFERAWMLARECEQQHKPYSVIQFDLDHFKSINDRYGHQAGDKVLSHAATMLATLLRDGDIAGRVGGEEFCVLLPDTSLDEAANIAERIRARLNAREILVKRHGSLRFSASFGVSCSAEATNYNFEQLQASADARLYQAKQRGRNQVCAR